MVTGEIPPNKAGNFEHFHLPLNAKLTEGQLARLARPTEMQDSSGTY